MTTEMALGRKALPREGGAGPTRAMLSGPELGDAKRVKELGGGTEAGWLPREM